MLNFTINIEQGTHSYRDGATGWVKNILDNITQYAVISDNELQQYADGIKESIERNMTSSIDFEGGKLSPISKQWAAKKGHNKNLFNKGLLYRSIATQTIPNGREIFVLPLSDGDTPRNEVAAILNERFPFFGILPERADSLLNSILDNAARYGRSAA